jgi:alpha-tubulin suppressor-like RCC1 family protein
MFIACHVKFNLVLVCVADFTFDKCSLLYVTEKVDSLSQYSITRASCGSDHSLAINEWGQVFSWGSDLYGQLGE